MEKKRIYDKQCMFGTQIYTSQENLTQLLVAMFVTLRRSEYRGVQSSTIEYCICIAKLQIKPK